MSPAASVTTRRAIIAGVGASVPTRVLTNADFEKMVETSDEWIITRTGIRERHIAENGTVGSDLAYEASLKALAEAKLSPEKLDLILVGTVTPDYPVPSSATILQRKLGATHAAAMDLMVGLKRFIFR